MSTADPFDVNEPNPWAADFAHLPELRCSLTRTVTVIAGSLAAAAMAGVGITTYAFRRWLS